MVWDSVLVDVRLHVTEANFVVEAVSETVWVMTVENDHV